MSNRSSAALIALLAVMLLGAATVSMYTDDGSDAAPVYRAEFGTSNLEVMAGSSASFELLITNSNTYLEHDVSDNIIVDVSAKVVDGSGNKVSNVTTKVSLINGTGSRVVLEGQETAGFLITISTGYFVDPNEYKVIYTYTVYDLESNVVEGPVMVPHIITINSDTSSSTYYNKFFGLFPNEFEGTLGEAWFTALVTLLLIAVIGVIISGIAAPIVCLVLTEKGSHERNILRKSLFHVFSIASFVFAVTRAIRVIGLSNEDVAFMEIICTLIYILVVAYLIWKLYGAVLDRIANRIEKRDSRDLFDNFLSFKPLFMYLGKIIIGLITVFTVMGMFGFDMAAIITSAGLVTLGITFGAQQILSQFFAGLLLLSTRPFKKGDLIQLGSTTVYRVRKVNVMNTELENWDNSDITIVPNNSLTSSHVKNITRDTLRTKAYIYVGVGYGTDLDAARKLMVEAAQEHPRVINDGSMAGPSTRIMDFEDSNILLRLCVWVDDYNVALGVGGDLRDAMYKKFNAAGVSIDYPQVVLHTADDKSD
ncbi:MAG: mechanosensitive ion channel [archaeon]|nr:mechanosensitive ion channel [archaeon]